MEAKTFWRRGRASLYSVRELNITIELWGVMFCALGILYMMTITQINNRYRALLTGALAVELLAAGSDAFAGLYRGQEGALAWFMVHAGNYMTFIANFALLATLTVYLCSRIEEAGGPAYHTWRRVCAALCGIMCLLTLMGAFFTIGDDNVYHRSDWHWLSSAYLMAVNTVNTVLLLKNRRLVHHSTLSCLLFYTLAPIIAGVAQVFVYGPNMVILAGMASLVVMFFEVQQHSSRVFVERTEELARSQVEVSESRIAVMVSQIQPHFLFNTLDTIYGLVDEDTEKAKQAIASFSRYLRANLDSLKHTKPVPIEREMEHVRTYLELERASDETRLEYELDLQATGFEVPALSVQTLAENAIKHGLGEREHGGKVIVRTREQLNEFTVAIIDDGVGFDPDNVTSDGVGLENTRARLAAMCNGELELHSEPNVGTTAIIHVPKEPERSRS